MKLAKDGKYETAYVSTASNSTSVGATDGSWLSFSLLLPVFDGKRLAIVNTYFHGKALDKALIVPFSDYIKAGETLAAKKKLGFSFKAQAQAIDDPIAKNAIEPICGVVKNALPVAQVDAVLAICAGKGKDKEKAPTTGEMPTTSDTRGPAPSPPRGLRAPPGPLPAPAPARYRGRIAVGSGLKLQ